MSTGWIIALIVIVAAAVLVAAALTLRSRGAQRGPGLKRRFGPEYDRALARHDGDAKAAERELAERVERHGSLRERPLEPAEREGFEARWASAQERFVDSPHEAVAEADRLLAELAGARGYPDGGQYEEQLAALSVHHAHHVNGYRRVHRVSRAYMTGAQDGGAGTEEMREAMVEARSLFDDLMRPARHNGGEHRVGVGGGERRAHARGHHAPWAFNRHHPKES